MNSVLIQGVTLSDIEAMIERVIDRRFDSLVEEVRPRKSQLVKRVDAAKLLGVSLPTLDAYARAGWLRSRHIGGRVYFDEEDLRSIKCR